MGVRRGVKLISKTSSGIRLIVLSASNSSNARVLFQRSKFECNFKAYLEICDVFAFRKVVTQRTVTKKAVSFL